VLSAKEEKNGVSVLKSKDEKTSHVCFFTPDAEVAE
jgi:hypothetical protein